MSAMDRWIREHDDNYNIMKQQGCYTSLCESWDTNRDCHGNIYHNNHSYHVFYNYGDKHDVYFDYFYALKKYEKEAEEYRKYYLKHYGRAI